ncbi:MAG: hypothetical protein ABIT38_11100 [Gemmatimonadaceae bacterium]
MSGCLRSIGCLVVLAVLAVVGWFSRDIWLPRVTHAPPAPALAWEPVTPDQTDHAKRVVESLSSKSGPVFANLTPAEASALVLGPLQERNPGTIERGEAAIVGKSLLVRATVDVSQLNGLDILGPLAGAIGKRPRVVLTGDLEIIGPGVGQFRVLDATIGEIHVPQQLIPQLVTKIGGIKRPATAARNGVVFAIPLYVGDVRVGKGHVTLYKSVK